MAPINVSGLGPVDFLVDSGSVVTLLNDTLFQKADSFVKEQVTPCNFNLSTANGQLLSSEGEINLKFEMNGFQFVQSTVIGDLGNCQGILGMDFLEKYPCILDLNSGSLKVGDKDIKLKRETSSVCARVQVSETTVIPPRSEKFVSAKLIDGKFASESEGLVEGTTQFKEKEQLDIPRCLVTVRNNEILVPITNFSNYEKKVKRDSVIADIESTFHLNNVSQSERKEKEEVKGPLPDHLKPLIDNISPNASEDLKKKAEERLCRYQHVWQEPEGSLGRYKLVKHSINVEGRGPLKDPPRRVPMAQREIVEKELDKMLKNDIIEPSSSPWSANLLLIRKKDNSIRFCVDFRKLNNITKKDAYPLPHIGDSLDALSGSQWFSCLDLAQGFFQLELDEKDREKTAFSTHKGLYQFKVLPFGLTNSPSTFERAMELILNGLLFERCLVYIDDIIVIGKTEEEALDNLTAVLQRFEDANLKLKPSKCKLFQEECSFLGHRVRRDGTTCEAEKVKAVEDWPTPKNVSEIRSFLGTCSYYRKYIPHFADIASPLTDLTRKGRKFIWGKDCQNAFEKLKQTLTSAPILAYPTRDDKFVLDTDASGTAIGAVLSQIQNGEEKVIAYASSSLNKSRRNYCTTYRELFAVVHFVKHFSHFLWGRPFLVRTDHSSLKWLQNFKNPEGMVARWITTLETYDFQIEHRKGSLHGNADGLSRIPRRCCKREDCEQCSDKFEGKHENQEKLVLKNKDTQHYFDSSSSEVSQQNSMEAQIFSGSDEDSNRGCSANAVRCTETSDTFLVCPLSYPFSDLEQVGKEDPVPGCSGTQRSCPNEGESNEVSCPEEGDSDEVDCPNVGDSDDVNCPEERESDDKSEKSDYSENPLFTKDSKFHTESLWLSSWTHEELVKFQSQDPVVNVLIKFKEKDEKPSKTQSCLYSRSVRILLAKWEELELVDGLLYLVFHNRFTEKDEYFLIAPEKIKSDILFMCHDARSAGHLGRDRTLANIKRHVYWPGMNEDIARWCKQCEMCARRKPGPGRNKNPMQHVNVGCPMERVAIDIMGPLTASHDGYRYIMVVQDYFSKFAEAYCLEDKTAQSVGDKLLSEFICRYGVPRSIHTDQGKEFEALLFQYLCQELGSEKTRTLPYNPQSDGMVERTNRTIQQMISAYINEQHDNWSDHLDLLLMAYRSTVHQTTGCTPNLIFFGREINLPLTVQLGNLIFPSENECPVVYVNWVRNTLERVFSFVRERSEASTLKQKQYHDRKLKVTSFEPGMLVWRWYPPDAKTKFGLGWTGPYRVIETVGNCSVKIENKNKNLIVHKNDLKPYEGREVKEEDHESSSENSDAESEIQSKSYVKYSRYGRQIITPKRYS